MYDNMGSTHHLSMGLWLHRTTRTRLFRFPGPKTLSNTAASSTVRRAWFWCSVMPRAWACALLYALCSKPGAVFQTSTEDRSVAIYHRMAELVRNRRIGELRRVHVSLPAAPGGPGDPTPRPVPEGLDWEMWLGPAPWAPYCPGRVHFNFRYVSDTGAGILADWGCHQLDTVQWANDSERTGPVEVEGTGTRHKGGLYDTFYRYDLRYRYANGVELLIKSGGTGLRFEGTEGWVGNRGWRQPVEASKPSILSSTIGPRGVHLFTCPAGEHRNFLDCVKSRRDPYFPAENGHRCASIAHIGTIAMAVGRPLRWDPVAERFPDAPDANRLLSRPLRAPWRL